MSVVERDQTLHGRAALGEPPAQGRPRRGRPARAHILMLLAGLLTAVAVYVALQDRDPGRRVAAAAGELRAGTIVAPGALVAVTVDVADDQAQRLIPADQLDALVGQVVTNNLMPGDLVGRSDVRRPAAPEDRRAIALPLPRERAVAGDLQTGDRVDVIAVEDGVARYIATGLPVITSGGGGDGLDGGSWSLTVSVDEQGALALARALASAEVMVTRATGATPADPDAVEGGASRLDVPSSSRDADEERSTDKRSDGDEDADTDKAEDESGG